MNILLCVATLRHAETTASYARLVAQAMRAKVTILHVAPSESDAAAGDAMLHRAETWLSGLETATRLAHGNAAEAILRETNANPYDLVVLGASERAGLLPPLFLGSVALQVIRRAPTSVLAVRQAGSTIGRILICTGGTPVADQVIDAGAKLAKAAGAHVTLLHVLGAVPTMYAGLHQVDETLPELLQTRTPLAQHLRHACETLTTQGIRAELTVRQGTVVETILEEAYDGNFDLIVIGACGATGRLARWLLGNVTRQVVEQSTTPVLVIKPPHGC